MPRLFTGLEVPANITSELKLLQSGLPGARWIERENFHLTLRFIGDTDGRIADEISDALAQVKIWPFTLRVAGFNVFGNSKPHSLYLAIESSDALSSLQFEHERIMQRVGIKPDGRKFTPHVTLARVRNCSDMDVAAWLARHGNFSCEPFEVKRFALYSAKQSTGGGPYVIERAYAFDPEPAE